MARRHAYSSNTAANDDNEDKIDRLRTNLLAVSLNEHIQKSVRSLQVPKAEDGWQDKMQSPADCHKFMFDNQLACDVYFVVPKQDGSTEYIRIGAHVYMLAARSAVFQEMFSNSETPIKEIKVDDADAETVQKVIRFLYCAEFVVNEGNAPKILAMAKKYKIEDLEDMCSRFLVNGINASNVLSRITQAVQGQGEAKLLLQRCLNYIKRNTKAILEMPEFLKLDNKVLSKIVENDELMITEIELFEGVLKWAKSQCAAREMRETPENLRKIIGDVIFQIRFPTMKLEEFTDKVVKAGVLSNDEVVELLKAFTVPDAKANMNTFPTEDRKRTGDFTSEVFKYDVFKDYQATAITTLHAVNPTMLASVFFKIDTPLTLKSLTFLLAIQSPYASTIYGTLTINQGSTEVQNVTINVPVDSSKQAIQFNGQSFPLGTLTQSVNLKGVIEIRLKYFYYSPPGPGNTTRLLGKTSNAEDCSELRDFLASSGPIYSVEFAGVRSS